MTTNDPVWFRLRLAPYRTSEALSERLGLLDASGSPRPDASSSADSCSDEALLEHPKAA